MRHFSLKLKTLVELWRIISEGKPLNDFPLSRSVQEFESRLSEYCGAKYALGVASGTDALIFSLKACGINSGDEVIVPAVSAFSTAAAVRWINAIPVFVDVKIKDGNIDISKIEGAITPKTKAIIPVHLNGVMAGMEKIKQLARRRKLAVIEDAAQAVGVKYKGHPIGYYGDVACLSFNRYKILGAFEGGAVVTDDREIAEKISIMRTYGAHPKEIHVRHPILGVSSRLSPLHAAVLVEKLPLLEELIKRARENYFLYSTLLTGVGDLMLPQPSEDVFINGHRFMVLTLRRDKLLQFLRDNGVKAHADYKVPLPYFDVLKEEKTKKDGYPIAEKISRDALFLPTHHPLSKKEVIETTNIIKRFFVEKIF